MNCYDYGLTKAALGKANDLLLHLTRPSRPVGFIGYSAWVVTSKHDMNHKYN
jgi:hypothetical protein